MIEAKKKLVRLNTTKKKIKGCVVHGIYEPVFHPDWIFLPFFFRRRTDRTDLV